MLTGALAAPLLLQREAAVGRRPHAAPGIRTGAAALPQHAALGAGVVDGLWVEPVGALARLRVRAGEALNGQGEVLRLAQDVEVDLTEPTTVAAATAGGAGFQARASSKPPTARRRCPGAFVLIAGVARQPRRRAPSTRGPRRRAVATPARTSWASPSARPRGVAAPPSGARLRGGVAALCFGLDAGQIPRVLTERMGGPP